MTRDISHGSKSKSHKSKHVYLGRLVGPWSPVLSPVRRVLWVFWRHCLQLMIVSCGVRAENMKETATHMHGHARTARPPGRSDERPDERASYKFKVQSPAPASSLADPPPAAKANNWGR